jgi:hypothetical protein
MTRASKGVSNNSGGILTVLATTLAGFGWIP